MVQSVDMRIAFNYASTDQANLDLAKRKGFNWIATGWLGHSDEGDPHRNDDDQPVLFDHDPKVWRHRKRRHAQIRRQIHELRSYHQSAHERGLKVALFTYEPSVPNELRLAYPEAFHRYPQSFIKRVPGAEHGWLMCIFDERTQQWIADKVEQTLRNIGPVDAWIYTMNETAWDTANITRHACDFCRRKPRWQAFRLMRDAMMRGASRVSDDIQMIHRMWGMHHPDLQYRSRGYLRKLRPLPDSSYDEAWADIIEPKIYLPSRDLPPFMKSLADESSAPWIMSKSTWSDYLLHQPSNPWLGHQQGKVNEILELSLESCHQDFYGFIPALVLRQFKAHLNEGLARGIKGITLTPIEGGAAWQLNLANLDIGLQLLDNPRADLNRLLGDWFAERYGGMPPRWLVRSLLDTEDIWAELSAYNGVTGLCNFDVIFDGSYNLANMTKFFLWPIVHDAWKDGAERFDLSHVGMGRAINNWNRQVAWAATFKAKVIDNLPKLPKRSHAELRYFVDRLASGTLFVSLRQKLLYLRMALEWGHLKPDAYLMRLVERWESQVLYLIANDEPLRANFLETNRHISGFKNNGWRLRDVTEKTVFDGIEHEETVIDGMLSLPGHEISNAGPYYQPRWF